MSEPETSATSSVSSESEPEESRSRSFSPESSPKDGEGDNEAPSDNVDAHAVDTLDAIGVDGPSADTEGLTLLWQADAGQEELKPLLPNFE